MKRKNIASMSALLVAALVVLFGNTLGHAQSAASGQPVPTPPLVTQLVAAAASGNWTSVMPELTSGMASLVTPSSTAGIKISFDQFGLVQSVETVREPQNAGGPDYLFTVRLTKGDIAGSLSLDSDGKITGLQFQPGEKYPPLGNVAAYVTKGDVHLPFNGEWYSLWGGIDPATNQPHVQAGGSQRYAYDLVIVNNGQTHSGDGSKNTDYYAYGQPILAPAAGTVVTVVDGIPENKPGEMNAMFLPGNCVIISDGFGEYFALCHLQPGRMLVKVGDHVQPGQSLGSCGNSGNASEPHLHFQMQDTPDMGTADGLPITFHRFLQNGKPVSSGIAAGKVTLQNQGTLRPAGTSK